jgi:predicted component of type VI protein secretion system
MDRTYFLSGFIDTADNSKFGVVDPSCKVDVAKGQFCLADFSAGFKVNLENIEMVVTHETYHEMQEGDEIEVYCMKVDGKHICKPTKTVHSYFD